MRQLAAFVLLSCMVCAAHAVPSTTDKMSLWRGGDGARLRGIDIYQRRVYPEWDGDSNGPGKVGPPFAQAEMDRLAKLGANWVVISHPGLFAEKPPYTLDADVQSNLDRLVAMVGKAGMLASITFRTGPGRSEFSFIGGEDRDPFVREHMDNEVCRHGPRLESILPSPRRGYPGG